MVTERTSTTFVGRELELDELLGAHAAATEGRGRLILLAGEPGIGKSRLAGELAAAVRARGSPVLWGRCWEDAGAPPYWPWIQVLRSLLRATDARLARELMGPGVRDIAQILPELRASDDAVVEPAASESSRFQLFDSVTTFLRGAATRQPLLIVLDDLHAADAASLLLLRFVASQLGDMAVLVVGAYRDVELTPEHPLTAAVPELAREPITRVLTLGGLQPTAVGRLIGVAANIEPHDLLVAAVWRETSGNPLFLGEAVRLLAAEGRLEHVTDLSSLRVAVPAGVRAVILRRVGHVGPEASQLLRLGAALGPEFRVEVLRALAGIPPAAVANLLDASVREGLLVTTAGSLTGYRFAHDLIREALYDEMSDAERSALHLRILQVLEREFEANLDDHLGELAYHAFAAVGSALPEGGTERDALELSRSAVDYATRAGERASRALAYEDAARLYGMALALLGRDFPGADEERTELLLREGDAMARAGDISGSRSALEQAAELARRTGSATHIARAALGIGGRLPWARPGRDTRLPDLLQDALVMLGGSDDRLRVRLLVRLACAWRSDPNRRDESANLSRQAVELARTLQDPASLVYALAGRYWATWWPENHEDRLPLAQEMIKLAEALGDAERLIDAHLMLYMSHAEHGMMRDAKRELEHVAHLADELRQPSQLWLGVAPRTLIALMEGRLEAAESLLQRELEATTPLTPARDEVSAARCHLFLLRHAQGRPAEALDSTRAAAADFPWYPLHRAALVLLLIAVGRDEDARAELGDIARDRFAAFNRDNEWLLGMCLAAEAAASLLAVDEAHVLYEELSPFAGRHAIGQAEGSVGVVDRYLGLLAGALGRKSDAVAHLRHAVVGNRGLGAEIWLAHAQHELATSLRAEAGPRADREAARLTAQAMATAERLGLHALRDRISGLGLPLVDPDEQVGRAAVFRLEGDFWTVALDGDPVRIRDSRGMHHIARLLGDPGREFHAIDLARGPVTRDPSSTDEQGLGVEADDAGPQLDEEAKRAYRARLVELEEEAGQAEAWNDPERAARARHEIAMLAAELSRAMGLGGRDRKAASASERARVSVTRAIRASVERVAAGCPTAGDHLKRTIRTGTYCSYVPDPRAPIAWQL